jgi:hypothetical protein
MVIEVTLNTLLRATEVKPKYSQKNNSSDGCDFF